MRLRQRMAGFVPDDRGAEVVEYAVVAALVVGATVLALGSLIAAIIGQNEDVIQTITGI